ncbi:MAG: alkaline phosphatase [Nitrospiraceae bacterium]|nr:MAG: alkaline phosphatase [Nitrospiraceae bacterium]
MNHIKKFPWFCPVIVIFFFSVFFLFVPGCSDVFAGNAKYIILMIADGWGPNHIEATNKYCQSSGLCSTPSYQTDPQWTKYWMSTFPAGGSYDTSQAWSNFNYVKNGVTNSAAAASALYSGMKTQNSRISVSTDGSTRFYTIGEKAKSAGFAKATGAITTVPVSDATPGAFEAHNDDRGNTYAIADEGFFGDPNTTGTTTTNQRYGGGHGTTIPPTDVIIGDGRMDYVYYLIRDKLRAESGQPGKHFMVERVPGQNGGALLMSAAADPKVKKLAGLFDHIYHNADGSGYNPENPTLSQSTAAALKVLSKNPNGFVLVVEGGAVDWASHANNMNQMIGELIDYNDAVQTVVNWIDDPTNGSDWNNTLLMVTGDHECGYLTTGPGLFQNNPLGEVSDRTLLLEDIVSGSGGRRASWEDADNDYMIDAGEQVYWYWNSGAHTNTLIPLYARGAGSELIAGYATQGPDPVRGYYLDNTNVFSVMNNALQACSPAGALSIIPGTTIYGNPVDLTTTVTAGNTINLNYTVTGSGGCPAQTNEAIIFKSDTWKYDIENSGATWMNPEYNDSGWTTGRGIFGTEPQAASYGYSITTAVSNTENSMFFRKTFYVCDPAQVTALKLNSLFDDGMVVYINGTKVYSQGVSGNPPAWNGGAAGHEAASYEAKDLTSVIGLSALRSLLVPGGANVIAAGVYNYIPSSSDIVWDGELVISHNAKGSPLFAGNETDAHSVDTSGWTNGLKEIIVAGDDALCFTPLSNAYGTFTFNSSASSSDTLAVSNNTKIASMNPGDGSYDILMQRFQVDSTNVNDGMVELAFLNLTDTGTASHILDAKVYISNISSLILPVSAVIIGSTGFWDGSATAIALNGGTTADRTVQNGISKFIYIVYDLADGQIGSTIQSSVDSVSVSLPDIGAGVVGTSNLLAIQACSQTGAISIIPGKTLYGNPVDLPTTVTTVNALNFFYTVTESGSCNIDPGGTYIDAENFTGTISQGTASFVFESSTAGYLGTGYLRSNGAASSGSCPAAEEGKEYLVNFPSAGTYKIWIRGYATSKNADSVFFGLDGTCMGALRETLPGCTEEPGGTCTPYLNRWVWTNFPQEDINTVTVDTPGFHEVNIWVRESGHLTDGIYLTTGMEAPTDVSHGIEVNPLTCNAPLFSGYETAAHSVNTAGWTNGLKNLTVTGDDAFCLTPLLPAQDVFNFCPDPPARIARPSPLYFTTLQQAYNASVNGDAMQSTATVFSEDLNITMNTAVSFEGGYDCGYGAAAGMTTLHGNLTVAGGTLIIGNFILD